MFDSRSGLAILLALSILGTSAAAPALAQSGAATDGGATPEKPKLVNLWRPGDAGQRMNIRGRVTAAGGAPVAGASIHIRQADGNGDYTDHYSTTIATDGQGRYQFGSVLPGQYYGTKHVHLFITHDAYRPLSTEILFKGDPNLADPDAPNAIFLEEAMVNDETVLYGRFDITLAPN